MGNINHQYEGQSPDQLPAVNITRDAVTNFAAQITGNCFIAGDGGYDKARQSWALNVEHHPRIIVEVKTREDVMAALQFAEKCGLDIAVQNTGHGVSHPCNGHMLIRTGMLNGVTLTPEAGTVTIETGAVWKDVVAKCQQSGFVPLSGFLSSVGITGYIIGGGFGWLVRKYGLALDTLLSVEMVTLQGNLLTASAQENSELFWGICAGGNFGIILSVTLKLLPAMKLVASQFYYPASQAPEVLE